MMVLVVAPGFLAGRAQAATEEYVVQSGDTLGGIAQKFGVTIRSLQEANAPIDPLRLKVGRPLKIPPRSDAPIEYMVQSGDTLDSIARSHGVTIAILTQFNELLDPDRLRVGQVILVPRHETPNRDILPLSVQRTLNNTRVRTGWRYIIIHHSATDQGTMRGLDNYHKNTRHMVNGLAYHFVIGNGKGMGDGEIGIGHRWTRQLPGGHLASEAQNKVSLGICLIGNYEHSRPTAKQMESLRALVHYLQTRCNIGKGGVRTHRQVNIRPTICPGRNFPVDHFLEQL